MKSARLLLPFVHGMNIEALEQAILLAKDSKATLVPASIIRIVLLVFGDLFGSIQVQPERAVLHFHM